MLQREVRDDRSVLSTDAIDEVMKLIASIDGDSDDARPRVRFDDWASGDADESDDQLTSTEDADELTLAIGLA